MLCWFCSLYDVFCPWIFREFIRRRLRLHLESLLVGWGGRELSMSLWCAENANENDNEISYSLPGPSILCALPWFLLIRCRQKSAISFFGKNPRTTPRILRSRWFSEPFWWDSKLLWESSKKNQQQQGAPQNGWLERRSLLAFQRLCISLNHPVILQRTCC